MMCFGRLAGDGDTSVLSHIQPHEALYMFTGIDHVTLWCSQKVTCAHVVTQAPQTGRTPWIPR